jgi:hypothetical protein
VLAELTTNQKGLVAKTAIVHEAVKLGIGVALPLNDERYDLILDFGSQLLRVQCKWAVRKNDVIVVRCYTCRRGPNGMIVRKYTSDEVDAFGVYCAEVGCCYLLPVERFITKQHVHLRLGPSRNNQRAKIHLAEDFEFGARLFGAPGPIAQLGERLAGSQKVAGSSPAGSITVQHKEP